MSGKIGVLALQGDVREHVVAIAELGAHPVEIRQPEDLAGIDGIILPGGESTTIALLLDSAELRRPLAERLHAGMPVFGTCAGMILLAAEVLDGPPDQRSFGVIDISVRRNAFGRQRDSFETELDIPAVGPDAVHAVFIRAPLVERVGPGVEVLATVGPVPVAAPVEVGPVERVGSPVEVGPVGVEVGRAAARPVPVGLAHAPAWGRWPVACRQGPVLVTSFHPELSGDLRLHDLFLKGAR